MYGERPPVIDEEYMVLYEKPDRDAVARVCNHPDVWPAQKPMYEAYHDLVASSNNGTVAVDYFRREFGRFYVSNGSVMSATPMMAAARSAVFGPTDIDIDGVQMHPNLLLHEMEKLKARDQHCPSFDALEAMCSDRDTIFGKCVLNEQWLTEHNKQTKSYSFKPTIKHFYNV